MQKTLSWKKFATNKAKKAFLGLNYYKKYSILLSFKCGGQGLWEQTKNLKADDMDIKKGFLNRIIIQKPFENRLYLLNRYVDRCRSFLSVLHIKSDPVTLIKRFKA